MDPTPNTFNYMVAGYVVFALVMLAYVISLVSRWKSLRREEEMLSELETRK